MKLEEAIGEKLAWLRNDRGMSQAQLGEALGRYLDKPWSRQAVNSAERGNRSFSARDLVALALALDATVPSLFLTVRDDEITMPNGITLDQRKLIFHESDSVGRASIYVDESVTDLLNNLKAFAQVHKRMGEAIEASFKNLHELIDTRASMNDAAAQLSSDGETDG